MNQARNENLGLLGDLGFRVADSLPVQRIVDGRSPELRPKRELLGRLLALKALWLWVDVHPDGESEETILNLIAANNLRDHLTVDELDIVDLSREDAFAESGHLMGWKNENCWPLAWILGFPDAPSVEAGPVDGDFGRRLMLDWLPNNADESFRLQETAVLRKARFVRHCEDLFYCAHNAVRSAQVGGDTVPEGFDPLVDGGCIHERRHALTWALSPGVDWDSTDLST